jgi:hypothetical protein
VISKKRLLALRSPAASAVLASSFLREIAVLEAAAGVGVEAAASRLREEECAARGGLVAPPVADFPVDSYPAAGCLADSAEAGWVPRLVADSPAG